MKMQNTSLLAYLDIVPELGKRQKAVYDIIKQSEEPITDKEISQLLQLPINSVTPRRNELVKKDLIKEAGTTFVYYGNKRVRAITWSVK